ncbi:MAG: 1-acyl-sn-glycerol-3-phosphate acyltransferase [Erysipelotrichaceae bacterium]|nr:1-acyl-sn-glycerol-3-phosphate acyltransferase [Erysipelotrichaceae bacterium]
MNNDVRRGLWRHKFVYHFLRITAGWLIAALRDFSGEYYKIKGKPVLLLSNHNSDFDGLLMVIALKRHFKFVGSANIMSGALGKLIRFLIGLIPREKGAAADNTVELIVRNLNAGIDVAMFPEGNKSWDGSTGFISKRTAEILKQADCGLVTYRFDGGYLRSPRWARTKRRGKIFGRVVNEYSKEQLDKLSVDEIYDIIVNDLQADAFQYQDEHHVRYRGEALAEGIENLLYLCPLCQQFDTIHSQGNEFHCQCGMQGTYDEYGYLNGELIADYDNTIKWNAFQKNWLREHQDELKAQTDKPFSQDEGLSLYEIVDNERVLIEGNLTAQLYGDRMTVTSSHGEIVSFRWAEITKLGMFRNNGLYLTCNGRRYEIYRPQGFALIKYFSLWRILTGKNLV